MWAAFTVWWLAQPHPLGFLPDPGKLFPARWFQFALGMWAATLVVAASPAPRSLVRDRSSRTAWLVLPVATAVGAIGYAAGWGVVSALGFGVTAVCLLVAFAHVPSRVFERGPLRWLTALGVISYSFYLLHQPVLLLTSGIADPGAVGHRRDDGRRARCRGHGHGAARGRLLPLHREAVPRAGQHAQRRAREFHREGAPMIAWSGVTATRRPENRATSPVAYSCLLRAAAAPAAALQRARGARALPPASRTRRREDRLHHHLTDPVIRTCPVNESDSRTRVEPARA